MKRVARRNRGAVFLGLVLCLFFSASGHAASSGRSEFLANLGQGISKKADDRYQSRWTLADWFESQRKSRIQDMWLASNRKEDLYQFVIGGRAGIRTDRTATNGGSAVESSTKPRQTTGVVAAYATFVGLEGGYTDIENDSWGWDATFAIRLFGDSVQNTGLTIGYGVRHREDGTGEIIQSPAPKVALTLYINKVFGIEGQYQWHLEEKSNLGVAISGSLAEAGVFIDFSLLRIFGTWSTETRERAGALRQREGVDFGLKAFF